MPTPEPTALVLGDDSAQVEAVVAHLRRAHLSVERLIAPTGPIQLAEFAPRDLLVVVPPIAAAARMFERLRGASSPWRHTGVLLVLERSRRGSLDPALARASNRMIAPDAPTERFVSEIEDLLEVAPRVAIHASVQLRLVAHDGESRVVPVENISKTGMFVALDTPLPVGTVFGFALDLPSDPVPILGQAGVVRASGDSGPGKVGNGVRFLSFGGEGQIRIDRVVARERQRTGTLPRPAALSRTSTLSASGTVPRPATANLGSLREEHAAVSALLEERLFQGLARRLAAADWYLTGLESGLESLKCAISLLDAVGLARGASLPAHSAFNDLLLVRQKLAEAAQSRQSVRQRVQALLDLRPVFERLRSLLVEPQGANGNDPTRAPEIVVRITTEIRRLVARHRSLAALRELVIDLDSARQLLLPGGRRRVADRIASEHGALAQSLGLGAAEVLATREGRQRALGAVDAELRRSSERLTTLRDRIFTSRFRHLATGGIEADLADPRTSGIVAELLAPGRDFLDRAWSSYRHALEECGTEPALLDRVGTLERSLRASELESSSTRRLVARA